MNYISENNFGDRVTEIIKMFNTNGKLITAL